MRHLPASTSRYTGSRLVRQRASLGDVVQQIKMHSYGGSIGPRPQRSYSQVGTVHACVKVRADALSMMPLTISTADDQVIESGPIVELAEKPNPGMTGRAFFRTTEAHLCLFGRAHWVLTLDPLGRPTEVYPVNPLQMTAKVDQYTGQLIGWKYRAAGKLHGREEILSLDEVHTIIDPDFEDPANPWQGLSPRQAVRLAISQSWKSDLANEASLDNGVEPGGYLTTSDNLDGDQRRELKQELEERHGGVANRRRIMLLQGGLEFKPTQVSFKDMELAKLKEFSRVEICAAMNVPPPVVGYYTDSNYAHANAAQKMFWTNTILPRASWIAEEWDLGIISRFESDRSLALADARSSQLQTEEMSCRTYKVAKKLARRNQRRFFAWFDASQVPAILEAALDQVEAAQKWYAMGTPLNHIYDAVDAPFPHVAWGDTGYKPIGLVSYEEDLSTLVDATGDPDGSGGSELPEDDKARRRAIMPGDAQARTSEAVKARLWLQWRMTWRGLERLLKSKVNRHFYELRKETLQRLTEAMPKTIPQANGKSITPDQKRDLIGQILFDIVKANEKLLVKVSPLLRESYRLGGNQTMQEAADATGDAQNPDPPAPFNMDDPEVIRRLEKRQRKITGMNRTLRRRLSKRLADGVANGQTTNELAEQIRSEFKIASNRAATIARTEIGAAVEEAKHEGRRQAGIPLKSWLWSRKEQGRVEHQQTEEETLAEPLPNNQDFIISGTGISCPHPRASGDPGQDVNCGCTTLSRYPDDSIKGLIERYVRCGFLSYDQLVKRDAEPTTSKDAKYVQCPTAT